MQSLGETMNFTKNNHFDPIAQWKVTGQRKSKFCIFTLKFQHFQTSQEHQTLHKYSLGETIQIARNNQFDQITKWKVTGQGKF